MRKSAQLTAYCIVLILFTVSGPILSQPANTISRTLHPVVLTGADVPYLLGTSVDEIRLLRYHSSIDQWEDIPFQIDELDDIDSYSGTKDGLLGAKDEIVFLSGSFGDKTSTDNWPVTANPSDYSRHLIEGIDPLTGEEGWIYVCQDNNFTRAAPDYIDLNQALDRVSTDVYQITHGGSGLQEDLLFKDETGGDDIDFLDRQKFRIQLDLDYSPVGNTLITVKEEMDEDVTIDLKVTKIQAHVKTSIKSIEYVANGNLRIHRILTLQVDVTSNDMDDIQFELPFMTTFYPEYCEWKTDSLEIPVFEDLPYGVTARIKQIRLTTDLNSTSTGMEFYNPYNTGGLRIDGRNDSGKDETLLWPGDNWHLIKSDPSDSDSDILQGSIVGITRFQTTPIGNERIMFFREDRNTNRTDTGDLVSYGNAGVKVTGGDIKGVLDYYSANYYIADNLNMEDAEDIVEKHINPLQIQSFDEHKTYHLAVQTVPQDAGTIVTDPDTGMVEAGTPVTFEAQANYGYRFTGWDSEGNNTENPLMATFDNDTLMTAHFELLPYFVLHTEPAGHPVKINGQYQDTPYTFYGNAGQECTVEADTVIQINSDNRYRFNAWSSGQRPQFTYFVPQDPETLTVSYAMQHKISTYVRPEGTGAIVTTPAREWIDNNTNLVIEAVPEELYEFSRWAGAVNSTQNPDTIVFNQQMNLFALFTDKEVPDTYHLAVAAEPADGGWISVEPDTGILVADIPVVLTATANNGYQFAGWSSDGENMQNPWNTSFSADTLINAYFTPTTDIVIQSNPEGYPVQINGFDVETPHQFTQIEGITVHIKADSIFMMGDTSRYIYTHWEQTQSLSYNYTIPVEPETLIVYYNLQHHLTLQSTPEGAGILQSTPDEAWVEHASQVIIEAIPATYYDFDRWEGSLTGMQNPDTLLIQSHMNIQAVFGNDGPVVQAPDTLFAEDDTLRIPFSEIGTWAIDNEEPDSSLIFSFTNGENVLAVTDSLEGFFILTTSQPDWNGIDTLIITFEDHLGASGIDTLLVTVTPVSDSPWTFALLDPDHESVYSDWPEQITFSWEPAFDPDEGDTIVYLFELDSTSNYDSHYLIQKDSLLATEWSIDWPATHNDRQYVWRVTAQDRQGNIRISEDEEFTFELKTPVISENQGIPDEFTLSQNYPNPFNGVTTIQYGLPEDSPIHVYVFNNRGQLIQTLKEGVQKAGYHQVQWLGEDKNSQAVASGLYFIVLQSPEKRIVQKAMYLK